MSGFISEPTRSDEKELALRQNAGKSHIQGQEHDRIPGGTGQEQSPVGKHGGDRDEDIEITASQKMLSAVSGSLLTSLLGMIRVYNLFVDIIQQY